MADESYIDLYTSTDEETGEEIEGMIVKGKDVIVLDAPEVLLSPETPLLTEAQDVAGAINELFSLGVKGGDFRAIADNGEDSIYVNLDTSDSSGGANCAYTYFDYTESITTETTVDDVTTTTATVFTKRIITELTNSDTDTLLLKTSYDEGTGEILGYTDRYDAAIYVGGGEVSSAMSGNADIAAIAWVLAKNIEQADSFEAQKRAYRKGLKQGGVEEEWDEPIEDDEDGDGDGDGDGEINIHVGDDKPNYDGDHAGNLIKGIESVYTNDDGEKRFVRIFYDPVVNNDGGYHYANNLRVHVTDADGNILFDGDCGVTSWGVRSYGTSWGYNMADIKITTTAVGCRQVCTHSWNKDDVGTYTGWGWCNFSTYVEGYDYVTTRNM